MKKSAILLLVLIASLTACRPEADPRSYFSQLEKWRKQRTERLKSENGWLTLAGLHWLNPGANQVGSAEGNTVRITPQAPARLGLIVVNGNELSLQPDPGANVTIGGKPVTGAVRILADADEGGPTIFNTGNMAYQVIRRGEKVALRIKDPDSEGRKNFHGIDYFPVSQRWIITARYEPYAEPRTIPITNIVGMTTDEVSPGLLKFRFEGKEYSLTPILEKGETDFFIIFRDQTSGKETYPAGRYLYASPPGPDGLVTLDFNKAYNPPCAFTPFATCPLPPFSNRLELRVEAGEKAYH